MPSLTSQLLVFRHAHAAKAVPGQDDFDRPLDERGRREAAEIGAFAHGTGLVPARILCSPAKRTRETLETAFGARTGIDLAYPANLYPGNAADYLTAVENAGPHASVMLIAHNPGIAELAAMLTGDGEADAMGRMARGYPTAGLAVIEFDGPLASIRPGSGRLTRFVVPER